MAGPAAGGGGSGQKRGRPSSQPGGSAANAEAAVTGGATQAVPASMGPSLQVHNNFAGTNVISSSIL